MTQNKALEQDILIHKAIEILYLTNDGDDLPPEHLKIVELGVNGFLSLEGQRTFDVIYANAKAGEYRKEVSV